VVDADDDVADGFLALAAAELADGPSLDVLQGGVLLINLGQTWFATRSAVEYYLWYASRLPWQARRQVVPLGGNTCVFRTRTLERVGFWDPQALTEDADLGIRLAALGATVAVRFEENLATREETPLTLRAFLRQRSRWDQGFIQVLRKGAWRQLPLKRRVIALLTLAAPSSRPSPACSFPPRCSPGD
jgi:cellulose synthase/poly-beta-1,6-N-acetylglucosamine synthase-like glycosyltransferase